MSRTVRRRWVLTGDLLAQSVVHVGGLGQDTGTDLAQARDGLDRPVLPGTALAGVIRAALGELDEPVERLWGRISGRDEKGRDDGTGEASWVWVDDATASADIVSETRESVSIDRIDGVAARGHLFTREVLPIGTEFAFRLVVDDERSAADDHEPAAAPSPARTLVTAIAALLRGSGVAVGAATTRGLGRVRLERATLTCLNLSTRRGMLDALRGRGSDVVLSDVDEDVLAPGLLRITVPWQPVGPLMVQVGVDGDVADAFPLTATVGSVARLLLPGSSIKGVLRGHAERIMRTITDTPAPEGFLQQMKVDGLGPVGVLFGTAGDQPHSRVGGWRGALHALDCLGAAELPGETWRTVRLLQRRTTDTSKPSTDEHRRALAGLQRAIDDLNGASAGVRFMIAPHVAVDRWTGGAAEGLLFAAVEPHVTDANAWGSIVLEIDTTRLGEQAAAALALLLFVLRDLCEGWIPFGHGTTRGMGAVRVDFEKVIFHAGTAVPWHAHLHGRSLTQVLADHTFIVSLNASWRPLVTVRSPA